MDDTDLALKFREAMSEDWEAIIDIHNSNVSRDENVLISHGFLLAKTTEKEIIENINNQTQYFVADNFSNQTMGFLAVSKPQISKEFLNQILWKDDAYRNQILSEKHLYIKIVATHPKQMGKGVAQFMYKSLYETFPNSFFSTFIVTKPISNHRSILFHEKQGFYAVGTLKRESFLDFNNYESVLMVKEI